MDSQTVSTQAEGIPAPVPAPSGRTQQIPLITPPKNGSWWSWGSEGDERNQLERDGSQSHNIRRIAAYGGLFVALTLYSGGLFAIALFLGLVPGFGPVTADMWHIVVAVLIALFTVPTVLIIAVLKVASPSQASEVPASVHEGLGKMVEKVFDKLAG